MEATDDFVALTDAEGQIAEGMLDDGETLGEFCKAHGLAYSGVLRWLRSDEERWSRYRAAREAAADAWAMEALRIADDAGGDVARDKLRVSTRLKIASKLAAPDWGEKLDVTVSEKPSIRRVLDALDGRLQRHDARVAEIVEGEFVEVSAGDAVGGEGPADEDTGADSEAEEV